jgi:hypothetical protein
MSSHVERIFKIIKLIPKSPEYITVEQIKDRLEREYDICVHERTIQRDMDLISYISLNEIDCCEESCGKPFRWFRKEVSAKLTKLASFIKSSDLNYRSEFFRVCDDIDWYLSADFVFDAIKKNTINFGMNRLFDGFSVLPMGYFSSRNDRFIVFVCDIQSAPDLIKKITDLIKYETSKPKSVLFYVDIDEIQWDVIIDGLGVKKALIENNIQVVVRFRFGNANDGELFDEYLQSYDDFQKRLMANILQEMARGKENLVDDNLLDFLEQLESLGKFDLFETHNEHHLTAFYNEWSSFLLSMANKKLSSVKIGNDAIGFDCDDSSNCDEIYSIKHDQIWVCGEIHDRLCRYYEMY